MGCNAGGTSLLPVPESQSCCKGPPVLQEALIAHTGSALVPSAQRHPHGTNGCWLGGDSERGRRVELVRDGAD